MDNVLKSTNFVGDAAKSHGILLQIWPETFDGDNSKQTSMLTIQQLQLVYKFILNAQ
jgi:hypothetical protein